MELRNRRGTVVDPVPFLVVAASAFAVVYSFGPAYLLALDVPFDAAVVVTSVVFVALVCLAYHRLVWATRPEYRGIVPAANRIKTLFYAIVAGFALLGLLALPMLA